MCYVYVYSICKCSEICFIRETPSSIDSYIKSSTVFIKCHKCESYFSHCRNIIYN